MVKKMLSLRPDQYAQFEEQRNQMYSLAHFSPPALLEPPSLTARMEGRGDRKFKVLAIDGGGIRGIIPLKVLTELERYIGPISNTFDLIAGTSTGGMIALALTGSVAKLRARDILPLYQTRAGEIFLPNPHRKLHDLAISALNLSGGSDKIAKGLVDYPLYTNNGLRCLSSEIFEGSFMKDTRTNVLIPAVDITNFHRPSTELFNNRSREHAFLAIQDVVCATAAAPTYFPHKRFNQAIYVDGGLSCNNPAEQAYWYARKNKVAIDCEHILSLGTGFTDIEGLTSETGNHNLLYWAKRIFPTVDATLARTIDYNLKSSLGDRYWRINPGLTQEISLDDHSSDTLKTLNEIGDTLVENSQDVIREIAARLQPEAL